MRLVIVLGAAIFALWFLVVKPIERTRDAVTARAGEILERITARKTHIVEGRAEILGSKEVSELALLELRMSATRTIEKTEHLADLFPLGTKKLVVRGHYRVKGGYRLGDDVSLQLGKNKVIARFPKPEILSVELLDYETLAEESGWLNRIQPADREQILRELREQMEKEALASGMLDTIEESLETRLEDLSGDVPVELIHELP